MGLFHKPVNTKLWKPIFFVVSLHPESVMYSEKKLYCRYCATEIWNVNVSFKPSRRCETWGSPSSQTGVRLRQSLNLDRTLDGSGKVNVRLFVAWNQSEPWISWFPVFAFPRFPWLLVTVLLTVSNVMQLVTPYRGEWLGPVYDHCPWRSRSSSVFLSPPSLPPSSLISVQLAMRTSLAVCYFQSIVFFFIPKKKMLLYWRSQAWAAQPLSTYITFLKQKGKHMITQHLAFVAFFFVADVVVVQLTSWYHILGRRCVSISRVSNWKISASCFFFSKVVVGIWCWKWGGEKPW